MEMRKGCLVLAMLVVAMALMATAVPHNARYNYSSGYNNNYNYRPRYPVHNQTNGYRQPNRHPLHRNNTFGYAGYGNNRYPMNHNLTGYPQSYRNRYVRSSLFPYSNNYKFRSYPKYPVHNLTEGYRQPRDYIVYNDIVSRPSSPYQESFVQTYRLGRYERITLIRVTDRVPRGGGFVSILAGGSGYNYTSLRFENQRNRPLRFTVEVYGKA